MPIAPTTTPYNKKVGYGPNAGGSGMDSRGRIQNQGQYQQQRYEQQQGPMVEAMARNYGRGTEMGFQDYGNIMGQMGQLAGPQGFGEFARTGGYSPQDIANMRSRGVAPIRAAYENAGREVNRQRSLQGGYAPNAIATQAKMAREQGQSMSDAATNVEATLAEARNRGRQFGLTGQNQALQGMGQLYGTTPGMAQMFGNQLLQGVGQGGQFGLGLMSNEIQGQRLPGQYETTMGKIGDIANMAYPWLDYFNQRNQQGNPNQYATPAGPPESMAGPLPPQQGVPPNARAWQNIMQPKPVDTNPRTSTQPFQNPNIFKPRSY